MTRPRIGDCAGMFCLLVVRERLGSFKAQSYVCLHPKNVQIRSTKVPRNVTN